MVRNPCRVFVACGFAALFSLPVVARIPDGDYAGTVKCQPGEGSAGQSPWTAPVQLKVRGAEATWTRDSATTRETIKSSLGGDGVSLEGYGGNYSANFQRVMQWDWKTQATLGLRSGMLVGPATIGSKDGRTVNWRCDVAITVGPGLVEEPGRSEVGASSVVQPAPTAAEAVLNPGEPRALSGRRATFAAAERPDVGMQQEQQITPRPGREQDKHAERSTAERRLPTHDSLGPGLADGKITVAPVAVQIGATVSQVHSPALAPAEPLPASLPQAPEKASAAHGEVGRTQPQELRRSAAEQVAKPAAMPTKSPPPSSADRKQSDGFTVVETLALIAGALLFGGVAYRMYPRFFQANAERYYASAWERFKKRIAFAAAWAAGGAILCLGAVMR